MKVLAMLSLLAAVATAAAVPVEADEAFDKRDTCPANKSRCNGFQRIRDAPCRCPNQVGPCALYACPNGRRVSVS